METMIGRPTKAEARERTREKLLATAEECFLERGYHATSIDHIAKEASYTKGAVYGNFDSKEDLFLAVYERQVERGVEQARRAFAEAGTAEGFERTIVERGRRDRRDERWLAVFFEFWAYVARNPASRERFAELHARALEPFVEATARLAAEQGAELPVDPRSWTIALNAMHVAITLERLTQPDVVDADLGLRMQRFVVEALSCTKSPRERRRKR
jgi:AcrR family transcriptional regulator